MFSVNTVYPYAILLLTEPSFMHVLVCLVVFDCWLAGSFVCLFPFLFAPAALELWKTDLNVVTTCE